MTVGHKIINEDAHFPKLLVICVDKGPWLIQEVTTTNRFLRIKCQIEKQSPDEAQVCDH